MQRRSYALFLYLYQYYKCKLVFNYVERNKIKTPLYSYIVSIYTKLLEIYFIFNIIESGIYLLPCEKKNKIISVVNDRGRDIFISQYLNISVKTFFILYIKK